MDACPIKKEDIPVVVDCEYGPWDAWGACSETCTTKKRDY